MRYKQWLIIFAQGSEGSHQFVRDSHSLKWSFKYWSQKNKNHAQYKQLSYTLIITFHNVKIKQNYKKNKEK